MSRLSEALARGEFVVTGEVGPPKGTSVEPCLAEAEQMAGHVVAVNVTDLQSAVMRLGSLAVCHLLAERGIEPVLQLTCRDRNRLALQAELLSAHVLGIRNVLCLTGDHNVFGDHPDSKPVFDLDAAGLLQCVRTLASGKDLAGNELDGAVDLYEGAVVSPAAEPLELELLRMERKVAAGARFFQTQAVFDAERFAEFMAQARGFGVPVLAGVVLLKSAGMARYMNENVSGVRVPDELIRRLAADKDAARSGRTAVGIAAGTIRGVRAECDGVHIMPMGWGHLVPQVLREAGLGTGDSA